MQNRKERKNRKIYIEMKRSKREPGAKRDRRKKKWWPKTVLIYGKIHRRTTIIVEPNIL